MGSEAYLVITQVATEPITLTDAKDWLNVDFSQKDALITGLISDARALAETWTGRAFATQQIQEVFTIARPTGGDVSGPINKGPNWYQYQEQLGANPFGAAQFYFDLAAPPFQPNQTFVIETKVTAFDPWVVFPQVTNTDGSKNVYVDNVQEPARMYFMDPVTANFWRFTYWAGYDAVQTYPLPRDLRQPLLELVAFMYDNREGDPIPQGLMNKFLAKRIGWI